jgi:hypothetical protein
LRTSPAARAAGWLWRLGSPAGPVPVVAVALAVLLAVQLGRTIHDVDIFWQLRLGELTLASGLPATEPFLAGKENEPLVPLAWLAQPVYAAVRLAGGWALLRLVDAIVWLGGFAAAACAAGRHAPNRWPAAIGLVVGCSAAMCFASVRPQSLGVLAFGLLVALARSGLPVRAALALGGGLLVLWQNAHPSVAVGVVYLGAAAVGEAVRGRWPWRLAGLTALAVAAMPLTPAGFGLFPAAAYNAEISKYLGISEWLPMHRGGLPDTGRGEAWLAVAGTAAVVAVRGRRVRAADLLPVLVLTALSVQAHRFIVFWGVAVIPVWADALRPAGDPPAVRPPRVRRWVAGVSLAVAAGVPVAVWPEPFADYYPFPAVRAMREAGVEGTVYTTYFWGGIAADAGHPRWKPTHDGRYYLFPREEWDFHFAAGGGAVPVGELERKYRPAAFLLWRATDAGLIRRLEADPGWRVLFADHQSAVFVRR